MANGLLRRLGGWIAHYLNGEVSGYRPTAMDDVETLRDILQPGDILLVEGNRRISTAIKYLTQSTWSHAALYIGPGVVSGAADDPPVLIEADTEHGVIASPLSKFNGLHTRICRAVGLSLEDRQAVVDFAAARIGLQYDLKNIFDLARYLLPTPPVPTRFRRRLLSLGSGEPTRAICSTLIAQAFQEVGYPVLPAVTRRPTLPGEPEYCETCVVEVYHARHHSLFTPRDFDLSPYFAVVKPTIATGFDYRQLEWGPPCVADETAQANPACEVAPSAPPA